MGLGFSTGRCFIQPLSWRGCGTGLDSVTTGSLLGLNPRSFTVSAGSMFSAECLTGQGSPVEPTTSTTSWEWATWLALRFTSLPAGHLHPVWLCGKKWGSFCCCPHGCVVSLPGPVGAWSLQHQPSVTSYCRVHHRVFTLLSWPPSQWEDCNICLATSLLAPCEPIPPPGSGSPHSLSSPGKVLWVQLLHVGSSVLLGNIPGCNPAEIFSSGPKSRQHHLPADERT